MTNPIKRAATRVEIYPLIRDRWSPRAFSQKRLSRDLILKLMEAARWAASCSNEQPWRFVVASIDEPEAHAKLVRCLDEGNQRWAPHAPLLMLTFVKEDFTKYNSSNRWCEHDLGLAMGNLTMQAMAEGLVVHNMGGILYERIREEYDVPDGFHPMTAVAVGYEGDPGTLTTEKYRREEVSPRVRKPLEEIFFRTTWGEPWVAERE
ncbi:MAG: nitroreductase family protein [Bryobacterales bacterium]|nr:nitroreductase family protein [Bryobacterales bacterium]